MVELRPAGGVDAALGSSVLLDAAAYGELAGGA
jgi:hypothetical protein